VKPSQQVAISADDLLHVLCIASTIAQLRNEQTVTAVRSIVV
jgi:hypothetical protein